MPPSPGQRCTLLNQSRAFGRRCRTIPAHPLCEGVEIRQRSCRERRPNLCWLIRWRGVFLRDLNGATLFLAMSLRLLGARPSPQGEGAEYEEEE